jgi:hypothetical protein
VSRKDASRNDDGKLDGDVSTDSDSDNDNDTDDICEVMGDDGESSCDLDEEDGRKRERRGSRGRGRERGQERGRERGSLPLAQANTLKTDIETSVTASQYPVLLTLHGMGSTANSQVRVRVRVRVR